MRFTIDPRSGAPPSEQLADQVRFAVASGRLAPLARLPAVRALAAGARINPNTVSRAWRELEREGVLEARRGEGMFVAERARDICREACEELVAERLRRAAHEAHVAGFPPERIFDWVRGALAALRQDTQAS